MMRSVKLCGCGLHRSPEIALIASTLSEPISYRRLLASATHADHARQRLTLGDLRRVEPMVACGRAEVPDPRLARAGQQAPARELVACPFADDRAREVADVVLVEHEHGPEVGFRQRLARAAEAVGVQPLEVDTLLEIDLGVAGRLERPVPAMARVDVIGADGARSHGRLARHGFSSAATDGTGAAEHDEVLVRQELVTRDRHQPRAASDADELLEW